jgi:RNA polymerase sigma-70 factor (ECF subfamily)
MLTLAVLRVTNALEQELELVFREHYPMLFRTAYGMLKNFADAEDVPQTIFLRLLRNGAPPDLKENAKRYLYRAVVNRCLDVIRSRKREKLISGVEQLEIPVDESNSAFAEEIHRHLAEAITELRPATVEILMLKYVHSYTESEIAKLLGVSRGTIAIKLFRSRARLRTLMRRSMGEQE